MAEEKTKGGSTIFRHQARERGFEAPDLESSASEEIVAHFEKHFGPTGMVFHELVSDLVHVDVHQLPPTAERPHWILFTTGMSDRPMTTPPGQEALQHAELMIYFLALFPLTAAELDYKLERGGDALLDRFDEHELDGVIAPARASLC